MDAGINTPYAPSYEVPTAWHAITHDRKNASFVDLSVLTSGTLRLIALPMSAGQGNGLSTLGFLSGATACVNPTHQWACLLSSSLAILRVSNSDRTTEAWAANTLKTFPLSSSYTVPSPGLYYIGLLVVADTPPSLIGTLDAVDGVAALANAISGDSTTGLTTIASFTTPGAAITGSGKKILGLARH